MLLGQQDRSLEQLEQQLQTLIAQTNAVIARLEGEPSQQAFPAQSGAYQAGQEQWRRGSPQQVGRAGYLQPDQTKQSGSLYTPTPHRPVPGRPYGSTS